MINKANVLSVIENNYELLPLIRNRVNSVFDKGLHFKYKPIQSIQSYLMQRADVIMFPSKALSYGGMVLYRNGGYYIHINTLQPKTYENFVWAHEFYHFEFEKERIQSQDEVTFITNPALDTNERMANLFAAELLINSDALAALFAETCEQNTNDPLAINIIRLIPAFELPYKLLVIKLAQDKLITLEQAQEIIDFDYLNHLPKDFDLSIIEPSKAIRIDRLNNLLENADSKATLFDSDINSIIRIKDQHLQKLDEIRHKTKEE